MSDAVPVDQSRVLGAELCSSVPGGGAAVVTVRVGGATQEDAKNWL